MSISSSRGNLNDSLRSRYELSLKMYHHRKFSKCLDLTTSIIAENPIQDFLDQDWVPKCYNLLVTLYGMLYSEIKTSELTKSSQTVLFPQYSKSADLSQEIVNKVQSGWLFDLIYELNLGNNEECILACLDMEIQANVRIEGQLGHILNSRGLKNSENVLKLYLSKDVAPKQGKPAVKEKLASMLSLESEDVIREWFEWVDQLRDDDDDGDGDQLRDNGYEYDSEYYEEEEDDEYDDDDDSFVTAEATGRTSSRDSFHSEMKKLPKLKAANSIPTSSKVTKNSRGSEHPLIVKLWSLIDRVGGVIPLISIILTILMLLNLRKLVNSQMTRRLLRSLQKTIEMGFKITYL